MTRTSDNFYHDGRLWNGYDYDNQAWVINGLYINCGHPKYMNCQCYGRKHENEPTKKGGIKTTPGDMAKKEGKS